MWKLLYPDSNGSNQSPINIATQLVVVVQPSEPLRWNGYDKGPLSMTIANNENNGANLLTYYPLKIMQLHPYCSSYIPSYICTFKSSPYLYGIT